MSLRCHLDVIVRGFETPLVVGVSRRIRCVAKLRDTLKMEWVLKSTGEIFLEASSYLNGLRRRRSELTLKLNNTTLDGECILCRVTTAGNKTTEKKVTIEVKGISC